MGAAGRQRRGAPPGQRPRGQRPPPPRRPEVLGLAARRPVVRRPVRILIQGTLFDPPSTAQAGEVYSPPVRRLKSDP